MASTTKVWTLDVTAQALDQGKVHLSDLVTINKEEASHLPPESTMTATNGKPLEIGEKVKLADLIRGMMYPSGNNAAYAIADHVARSYFGPNADWHDFVWLMNNFAASLGQTHTHFTNPAGLDNANHYTTARELAKEFNHGLQDPFFAQVEGFTGTYTATTQGPNGPKTYMFNRGSSYTGWEGDKNGITPNCSGAAKGCIVRAATRIGRRMVVATMQGTRGAEENAMMDYGFALTFHPDLDGWSDPAGAVDSQALDCFGSDGVVTAAMPPSGPASVALWQKTGPSIAKLQQVAVPGSDTGALPGDTAAVARMGSGDIVAATVRGSDMRLSRWNGSLQLLASDIPGGLAKTVALQPISNDMFLSAVAAPDGSLVIRSWRLTAGGTGIDALGTYIEWGSHTEVAIASPMTTDVYGHVAMTAAIDGPNLKLYTWAVDSATGEIVMAGANRFYNLNIQHPSLTPIAVTPSPNDGLFAPKYYALGYLKPGGRGLAIDFFQVGIEQTPTVEGSSFPTSAVPGDRIKLAPLGTGGVMAAINDAAGNVQLTAWDAHRNADDTITTTQVAQENEPAATSLNLCRFPVAVHADGKYVTATKELDGQLHVRAYRSGDRPN
jgi:hypothetical protein